MKSITFGNRPGEVRKEKKISQDVLAKKIARYGALITRYGQDEVKPAIEMASQIAGAKKIKKPFGCFYGCPSGGL